MLIIAGTFGAMNGLIAIIHDEVYVVGEERIVAFDFTQWGWIHLIAGGIVMLAGFAIIGSGATWARLLGVAVATIHAVLQIAWIEAYPFWTLATIGIDLVVIYGLMVPAALEEPPAA